MILYRFEVLEGGRWEPTEDAEVSRGNLAYRLPDGRKGLKTRQGQDWRRVRVTIPDNPRVPEDEGIPWFLNIPDPVLWGAVAFLFWFVYACLKSSGWIH